jgi:predicted Zn-ribbon and HTH transcriptional regulator
MGREPDYGEIDFSDYRCKKCGLHLPGYVIDCCDDRCPECGGDEFTSAKNG